MNKVKLFIDDDAGKPGIASFRNPPDDSWMVARSSSEAIALIKAHGVPEIISFDHDLGLLVDGSVDTSMKVIDYLIDNHYDSEVEFLIHSQNPIGALNIEAKIKSWKKSKLL
jgi:hypothetical protein